MDHLVLDVAFPIVETYLLPQRRQERQEEYFTMGEEAASGNKKHLAEAKSATGECFHPGRDFIKSAAAIL
jgi:hypothetical protein